MSKRLRAALVLLTMLSATVVAAPAASAGALPPSCGPNFDPYALVPKDWRQSMEDAIDGNATGTLYMSIRPVINNQPIFWVWGHGLKAGDVVSLDWSDDGHRTWHPCHATVAKGHTSVTTKAVNQVPGRSFRPCVKHAGHGWKCAGWMSAL